MQVSEGWPSPTSTATSPSAGRPCERPGPPVWAWGNHLPRRRTRKMSMISAEASDCPRRGTRTKRQHPMPVSCGRAGQLCELHEGDDEHRGTERDEPVPGTPAREVGADAHQEQHAARNTVARM